MQFEALPFEFARHLQAVKFPELRYDTHSQICESFPGCNAMFFAVTGSIYKECI